MVEDKRGTILHMDRARQVIEFTDLRYNSITPTDIDGLIEYRNKAYIFIELKHGDTPMPKGQELAITRLVDDLSRCGKICAAFLCEHNVDDCEINVKAADSIVRRTYFKHKWHDGSNRKLKKELDLFIEYVDKVF